MPEMRKLILGDTEFEVVDGAVRSTFVTPEMFGAVGDGVTDDTSAIQNAMNSGKPVRLISNEYLCGILSIPSNLTLTADNKTIRFKDIDNTYLIGNSNVENVYVEGVKFDFGTQTNEKHALSLLNSSNIKFVHCSFANGLGYSTRLNDSAHILFDSCYFANIAGVSGNPGGAIYGQNMSNLIVRNCTCEYVDDHFVYVAGVSLCQKIVVDGNIIKNSGESGLTSGAAITIYANSTDVTITNNIISGCRTGIQISNYGEYETVPSDVIIANNQIDNSVLNSISIIGLSTAPINRLILANNVINNSGQDGVLCRYANNVSLKGTTINASVRNGIDYSGVNYSVISGVTIHDAKNGLIIGNSQDSNYNVLSDIVITHSDTGTQGLYIKAGTGNKVSNYTVNGYTTNFLNRGTDTILMNVNAINGSWIKYAERQSISAATFTYNANTDGFIALVHRPSNNAVAPYVSASDSTLGQVIASSYGTVGDMGRRSIFFPITAGHTYSFAQQTSTYSMQLFIYTLY